MLQSRWLLPALLAAAIVRLWIMPMASSFWVDEAATHFVVQHGAGDASLRVAPQVAASVYYVLPRAAGRLFGFSEWAYRLPSLLALGLALWFVARIARRFLHPEAAWFTVFCCLAFRPFDYLAADARPYALGTCVVAAGAWLLVRWLDSGRWRDAACFAVVAAMVCQVHLVFWPVYLMFGCVAGIALLRRDTPASRTQALAMLVVLAASLGVVLLPAMSLMRNAGAHVIVAEPQSRDLSGAVKLGYVTAACAAAALAARWKGWTVPAPAAGGLVLIAAWWLMDPLSLFAFSHFTGNSVFLPRYFSIALPGAALATAAVTALFVPKGKWMPLLLALGAAVTVFLGNWSHFWPAHHNSDWRGAAQLVRRLSLPAGTPVICPSPFVEARPPVWRTDYPIDSFLYSNLLVYPVPGKLYPFPFERSREAEQQVEPLWEETLSAAPQFVLFGGAGQVSSWREWFRARAGSAGWVDRQVGTFGDVYVVLFQNPAAARAPALAMAPNRGFAASRPAAPAR